MGSRSRTAGSSHDDLVQSKAYDGWRRSGWWRYIHALFGSMNISFLIIANLSIMHGFQGSTEFLLAIFDNQGERSSSSAGLVTALKIFSFLAVAKLSMLGIRKHERIVGKRPLRY